MDIVVDNATVKISGNIKSVSDYQKIKNTLGSLTSQKKEIDINIVDSISMTSSVIGYFNKLVLKDNIKITMGIGSDLLMELVEDLNLKTLFNAHRI